MARLVSFVVLWSLLAARPSLASQHQGLANTGEKPLFLAGWAAPGRKVDASNSAVLQRRISLDVTRASLGTVLRELARQSRLDLTYDPTLFPASRVVSLHVREITMLAALTEVLVNTGFDVLVQRGGQLALVPATGDVVLARSVEPGVIEGKVTDAKTGDGLGGVEVLLEGTRLRVSTNDKGYYRLSGVDAGNYTLAARRVGYAKQSRAIAVAADQILNIDFALQPAPTVLDEIVTTVTGEQQARELGHVIGRINADSLVKEAPITSISELLTARVPGLQVFNASGVVGGSAKLQIRSVGTLLLNTEPIVIIDGVRYTTQATGRTGAFSVEETSRLNDINPNDVENIEVVKGPSAATLYGTDAANGVIIITTKRGKSGATRWNAYARASESSIPKQTYPDGYFGWGTIYGIPNYQWGSCSLAMLAGGYCTQQDSVVKVLNPLNDPDYSVFHNQPSWQYGLSTSGGRSDLRYYFSGDYEDETGAFQMPRVALERLKLSRGVAEIPAEQLNPNTQSRLNLRGNVAAGVARGAELLVNTGYINGTTRTIASGANGAYGGAAMGRPGNAYGDADPAQAFSQTSTEHLDRYVSSASVQWRPTNAIQSHATVGVDLANNARVSLVRPGEGTIWNQAGMAGDDRTRQLSVTGDIGVSATVQRGRLSFRTSVGAQYARAQTNVLLTAGVGLPPGAESPGQAAYYSVTQDYSESATLGGYAEETIGINNRLFLTAALRVDGATAFGRDYSAATYPKVSASWVISDEPFMPRAGWLDELRLRYAFGASGQQAFSYMALPDYGIGSVFVGGQVVKTAYPYSLGNPLLRPERVREHEFGLDAGAFGGRARVALTWFKRKTVDGIVSRPLSPGYGTFYDNVGLVRGHGFEAEFTLRPIESRALSWQLTFNHAVRRSALIDLGGFTESKSAGGSSYVEGYPLGARFIPKFLGYDDANGDNIIVGSEVLLGDMAYAGESTPPSTQTLTSSFGLLDQRVRLSALFERRTGYTQIDQLAYYRCQNGCRQNTDPSTPLVEQAKAVASLYFYDYQPTEDGTFVRFRELSAAVDAPERLARALRVRTASLSLSVRNLALWSSFSGPDPESSSMYGASGGYASRVPQGRTYTLRFDLGL